MTTFVDFSGQHWVDEHGGWLWCAPRAKRRPEARQIPGDKNYEGCRFCGGVGHRADECEARWRSSMAKLIASMARRKGNFWVENETKKLLQPQRYAAKKTPEARTRKWGKGEGKDEAKKASDERKKKKTKKAQEAKAREEAKTEGKKKKKEESEEEGKEGRGKGKGEEGKGKGKGEGEVEGEDEGEGKGEGEEAEKRELEMLEDAGREPEAHGRATYLPRNVEEEPASPAGKAEAETAAAAAAKWAAGAIKQDRHIWKIAKERGLSLEDAMDFWFDKVERFALRRGLRLDDAISVWLKEKEAVDDGKK